MSFREMRSSYASTSIRSWKSDQMNNTSLVTTKKFTNNKVISSQHVECTFSLNPQKRKCYTSSSFFSLNCTNYETTCNLFCLWLSWSLFELLIIVLLALTWSLAQNFIMPTTTKESQDVTNISIPFLWSRSHIPWSTTMIKENRWKY